MELLKKEKYRINNVDITIILQDPKLGKNKILIRDNIVKLMNLKKEQVNVKAGTAEKLGEIGKGKGVISFVTLLIEKVG
jgi:2-C-methyl-D-erythritol 2,4-cyclodiphosphate synthase